MKKFSKFLFFYSIAVASLLFIGALFFIPALENFVLALIFLPVVLYFWITITNPTKVSPGKWSVRILVTVLVFSTLGILAYSMVTKNRPAPQTLGDQAGEQGSYSDLLSAIDTLGQEGSDERLLEILENIQEELDQISADQYQLKQVVGIRDFGPALDDSEDIVDTNTGVADTQGQITPKGSQKVKAYEDTSITSRVVGDLSAGVNYPFFESKGTWYLVSIDDNLGWVSSQEVEEI